MKVVYIRCNLQKGSIEMFEQKEIKAKTKEGYKREFDTLFFNPRFIESTPVIERRGYWITTVKLRVSK